jgi:CRISPR/Cas system-associated endoribonuclease Cas2
MSGMNSKSLYELSQKTLELERERVIHKKILEENHNLRFQLSIYESEIKKLKEQLNTLMHPKVSHLKDIDDNWLDQHHCGSD